MKYKGNICNVCGRPIDQGNRIPEKFVSSAKFGTESTRYVEVHLKLDKVSYGYSADVEFQNSDGHICIECLADVLIQSIPDIPF